MTSKVGLTRHRQQESSGSAVDAQVEESGPRQINDGLVSELLTHSAIYKPIGRSSNLHSTGKITWGLSFTGLSNGLGFRL